MSALIFDPITKLVIVLLIALALVFGFKHYNGLNQKVGKLEMYEKSQTNTVFARRERVGNGRKRLEKN